MSRNLSLRLLWQDVKRLDNMIVVVNCNLQRLDGPVRGNAKIIQELEGFTEGPAGKSSKSCGMKHGTTYFEEHGSAL